MNRLWSTDSEKASKTHRKYPSASRTLDANRIHRIACASSFADGSLSSMVKLMEKVFQKELTAHKINHYDAIRLIMKHFSLKNKKIGDDGDDGGDEDDSSSNEVTSNGNLEPFVGQLHTAYKILQPKPGNTSDRPGHNVRKLQRNDDEFMDIVPACLEALQSRTKHTFGVPMKETKSRYWKTPIQ